MERIALEIQGMSCGHCVASVRKAIGALDGVTAESVSVGRADVTFDASKADGDRIAVAVTSAGYPARVLVGA